MAEAGSGRITAEELLRLPLFEGECLEGAEWIASKMGSLRFAAGDVILREGDPAQIFAVVLEGELHFRRSGYDTVLVVPTGQATGVLPFSRIKVWIGRGWAAQPTRLAVMDASHLRELVYRAPVLAQRLVSQMTDRTREFTRMEESSNRLLALGKLAAGLAHELNNPASAAVRSSVRLRELLEERRRAALALRGEAIPDEAHDLLADLGEAITKCAMQPGSMDALERADLESDLGDWLECAGAPGQMASALVDAGITVEQLRPLAAGMSSRALGLGLRVLVADHEILCLAGELEESARRMSDLVQAVKSYSYMDQTSMTEVEVEAGLDATLRMFQYQLKHGVEVARQYARDLPRLRANGSALNQIWTNLIDNALDSMALLPPERPRKLSIRTCHEPEGVLVEIADNGPGISEDIRARIFEPFFTTKSVGEGTGLGLDIVQRIIRTHKGSIRFESEPGRTVFQVRLP